MLDYKLSIVEQCINGLKFGHFRYQRPILPKVNGTVYYILIFEYFLNMFNNWYDNVQLLSVQVQYAWYHCFFVFLCQLKITNMWIMPFFQPDQDSRGF